MKKRNKHNSLNAAWSVYEVHLASWMRPDKNNEEVYNSYQQITERLVPYVKDMGFTCGIMPVMEHPLTVAGVTRAPVILRLHPVWHPGRFYGDGGCVSSKRYWSCIGLGAIAFSL